MVPLNVSTCSAFQTGLNGQATDVCVKQHTATLSCPHRHHRRVERDCGMNANVLYGASEFESTVKCAQAQGCTLAVTMECERTFAAQPAPAAPTVVTQSTTSSTSSTSSTTTRAPAR